MLLRPARPVLAACVAALVAVAPAAAQEGNVDAGRHIAQTSCLRCHAPGKGGKTADFRAIAAMPSTTALSLGTFMRTSHPTMPNVMLSPAELRDVIAYILSLKAR